MSEQQRQEDPEPPNDLFSISISLDAENSGADDDNDNDDDAAEAAAGDKSSSVDRTFQSEEEFQKQKASYVAKIYQGGLLKELVRVVRELGQGHWEENEEADSGEGKGKNEKVRLGKKEVQLLGYAVGEMYFDGEHEGILELCGRVREWVVGVGEGQGGGRERDGRKLEESLERWEGRCRERLAKEKEKERGREKEEGGMMTT